MLAAFTLLAGLGGPPDVPPHVPVVWEAPEQCPAETEIRERVGELVAPDPLRDRWVFVAVRAVDGRYFGTVRVSDSPTVSRRVDADSCQQLADVAVAVVAVALTEPAPVPVEQVPLAEVLPKDKPVEEEATPPAESKPPEPVQPPIQFGRAALRLDGGVGWGALPGVGGGMAVTPAILWPHARLELRAGLWARRTIRYDGPIDRRLTMRMGTVALRACGVGVEGRWEFPLCGGIEGGLMLAQSRNVELLHGPARPWVAAHASVGVTVRVADRVGLALSAEPWVALVRGSVLQLSSTVEGQRFGARGFLGLDFRFGGQR